MIMFPLLISLYSYLWEAEDLKSSFASCIFNVFGFKSESITTNGLQLSPDRLTLRKIKGLSQPNLMRELLAISFSLFF